MQKNNNDTLVTCQHIPSQNHLLASLSAAAYGRVLPNLKLIRVRKNEILSERGRRSGVAYFPVNCVLSIYHILVSGESTEIAIIGNEGMFDITHFMGGVSMPYLVKVETAGHAFILDEQLLKNEIANDETVRLALMHYAQALLTQMAQSIVCHKDHSLIQQLCLLLLLVNDKVLSDDLLLTQEGIAHMIGVRRASITEAAGKLRDLGLIDYRRGHVTVIDRAGLEKLCCECYEVVTDEFKRLLNY